jgi:Zn finger protein HypA/HybF involved in hydrogenase expression
MSQEIVRCPYCVLDSEFQPMFRRSDESFVCRSCGHTSSPEDPHLRCPCPRCHQMSRVTTRLSRDRTVIEPFAS